MRIEDRRVVAALVFAPTKDAPQAGVALKPDSPDVVTDHTGATFGDFDGDGRLDLFVAGYVMYDFKHPPAAGSSRPPKRTPTSLLYGRPPASRRTPSCTVAPCAWPALWWSTGSSRVTGW